MSSLTKKTVVVTRVLHQADELNEMLIERGATVLAYPCIAIVPPANPALLNQSVRDLLAGGFDWVVFTSSNGVRAVADVLHNLPPARHIPVELKIAAIGEATAQFVRDNLGVPASLISAEHNANQIANAVEGTMARGARIFLPQSEIAHPALKGYLEALGAVVTAITAYRTEIGSGGDDVPRRLAAGRVDAIIFSNPSTVENFLSRLQAEGGYISDLNIVCLAAIGQTTAQAIERCGLAVSVVAPTPSVTALADELEHYFAVARISTCLQPRASGCWKCRRKVNRRTNQNCARAGCVRVPTCVVWCAKPILRRRIL